jgi:DNA-directed RNA polymerase subunit RPC12/RpoP
MSEPERPGQAQRHILQRKVARCENLTCRRPKIKADGKDIGVLCPDCGHALIYKRVTQGKDWKTIQENYYEDDK